MNLNDLPQYRSIKSVRAARIESISAIVNCESLSVTIPGMDGLLRLRVDAPWLQLNQPVPGGYVVASDGLMSFWPAKMFESSFRLAGVRLADYVRDFCRKVKADGYTEEMHDEELFASMPSEILDSLALRFIADKAEYI